jgi:hypothetical protein
VEREIVDGSEDKSSQASNSIFDGACRSGQLVGCMFVPARKKTNEDGCKVGSVKSESSDNSKAMPPIKRLKLEDDGSVESIQSSSFNSSIDSDSTRLPTLMLHRVDSYSSSDSSASGDEEAEFEIEVEEVNRELLPVYNVRGNELPVPYRVCILCGELNHTHQDCPVEKELSFDMCLAMSDLNANDVACISAYKGTTTSENMWFLDTAAASHMGIHKDCLLNCKTHSSRCVKVGNGLIEPITTVGDFHGMKASKDDTWQTVTLKGFKGARIFG